MSSKVFRSFRRILIAALAPIVAVLAFVVAPVQSASAATVDVYTNPGRHDVNGRQWQTWCENYSSTVQRCFTEIVSGGIWVHNNITYLPAPRSTWASNPLGKNGTWTSSGSKWRTECDTALTGRNGCRSFIMKNGSWAFNNMVRFGVQTKKVDVNWRPSAVTGTTYRAPGDKRPIVTHESLRKAEEARKADEAAKKKASLPAANGKTWNIQLKTGAINSQGALDRCSNNPGLWAGQQHVVAHNYCNGWASNSWHNMKRGDTVIVKNTSGTVILRGIVDHDLTAKYGTYPSHEPYPFNGTNFFWVQTSWKDSIHYNANHVIVVRKTN